MRHSAALEAPDVLQADEHDLGVRMIQGAVFFNDVDVFGRCLRKVCGGLDEWILVVGQGCQEERSELGIVDALFFPLRDAR